MHETLLCKRKDLLHVRTIHGLVNGVVQERPMDPFPTHDASVMNEMGQLVVGHFLVDRWRNVSASVVDVIY
jgi:hypothetical protein